MIYRRTERRRPRPPATIDEESKDREGDPELVSTEGTVDGGIFRFRAAHFEWLLAVGEALGLGFRRPGQAQARAGPTTLQFCDELQRLYGSEDDRIAEGASFAVENWAAAGFWQELEDGLLQIKATRHPAPEGRLLHLAQPRRGPARRPHDGGARGRLLRPRSSIRRGSSRGPTKCSTPSPSSGTAWRTTGCAAMVN